MLRAEAAGGSAPTGASVSMGGRYTRSPAAPDSVAASYSMANIASQEKRIHRAERERIENRRRTSQVKTWFRRLETAVGDGDAARADEELRELVSRVDRAVKSGALHRNTGARRRPAPRAARPLRCAFLNRTATRRAVPGG